jgi:PncC family amidohydrolase
MDLSAAIELGKILRQRNQTLAVAESCTGGLIGHMITEIPGSSAFFLGGVVAYAYEAKERQLGVSHNTLYEYGAVSQETALEMARGARRAFSTDYGLSVTGIAGPAGGLPGKPVGLTWIAISGREDETAEQYIWQGDRQQNKLQSAEAALALLLDVLQGNE